VRRPLSDAIWRAVTSGRADYEEEILRLKTEELIAVEKAQRAELYRKLNEVLATIPLGKNHQSKHFQAIKYVIDSAHNATESKSQGAWTRREDFEEEIRRLKAHDHVASEKAERSHLHRKLDEVLATIPLGKNRQSQDFLAIRYVIESAHTATESKRQGAWYREKTKSSSSGSNPVSG
jgi:hypothetical protein